MEARGVSTNMMQDRQPLWGKGLTIRDPMVCLLQGEAADWDDLPIHQELPNQTPKFTAAHALKALWKGMHLKARETIEERKITKIASRMLGDCRRESKSSKVMTITNQTYTPFKKGRNSSITSESWNDALNVRTMMQSHSPTYYISSTCPLYGWHVCKSNVCALHSSAAKRQTKRLSSMCSPTVK